MKICSSCKLNKDLSEFNRNRSHKDGLQNNCRTCQRKQNSGPKNQAYCLKYAANHRKEAVERAARWAKENRDHINKSNRDRFHNDLVYRRACLLRSFINSSYKRGSKGNLTRIQLEELLKASDYKCNYCGSPNKLEFDHIVPLSKGGTNQIDNIQILCRSCNASKGNYTE